jgi:predicted RNase H-like HicB family nuclease
MKGHYEVTLEPTEDGWWLATVPSVQGCLTQAKSMVLAKRRIRKALALFVRDATSAELVFRVELPRTFRDELERTREDQRNLERTAATLSARMSRLADEAVRSFHMSTRDASEVFGLSHQRIDQLVREARKARRPRSDG